MKILFLGGDKRQLTMIRRLQGDIEVIGFKTAHLPPNIIKKDIRNIDAKDYDIILLPMSGLGTNGLVKTAFGSEISLKKDFFKNIKKSAVVYTGARKENLLKQEGLNQENVISFLDDKKVLVPNAKITSEGIIKDIILANDKALYDSNILILGSGNVGTALLDNLAHINQNITITVINKEECATLKSAKKSPIFIQGISSIISNIDIIINTIPLDVLDKETLSKAKANCYFLDIASHPEEAYGDKIKDLNMTYKHYRGIPGDIAPVTAGEILVRKVNERSQKSHG